MRDIVMIAIPVVGFLLIFAVYLSSVIAAVATSELDRWGRHD